MKNKIIITILPLCICSCQYKSSHTSCNTPQGSVVQETKLISTTPVKNQGKSPLCWAYAMLATMESEHIMKGDSVNLSVAYIARMMLQEKAVEYYFSKGTEPISMRGMAPMLIHYINKGINQKRSPAEPDTAIVTCIQSRWVPPDGFALPSSGKAGRSAVCRRRLRSLVKRVGLI